LWVLRLPQLPRLGGLPLQAREPRRAGEGGLRQGGVVQLEERRPALHRAPEAPGLLRRQTLELLRPGAARRRDRDLAAAAVRALRLRGPPRPLGHPSPPAPLRGA